MPYDRARRDRAYDRRVPRSDDPPQDSKSGGTLEQTSFVRIARPRDAEAIGRIQVLAWRTALAETLGGVADLLDDVSHGARWSTAITAPPGPGYRVVVAVADETVVGFAALAPAPGAGGIGEVVALEVGPDHWRNGHGSRLLAACVDVLRAAGAGGIRTWALEGDAARRRFLDAAGLRPEGATRALEVGGRQVREDAWSARL